MFKGLSSYQGGICIILSGNDLTADEFDQVLKSSGWLADDKNLSKTKVHRIENADHTFSTAIWQSKVEQITLDFVTV